MPNVEVLAGDCLDVMRELAPESVDAIVTDPPYGLGFMGREWDDLPPGKEWAEECLRVLKPGGHLLAFGGTRTYHRLAVAVEDAGFEIRDSITWIYGSGFPKSLDVSKAIDRAAGATREVVGLHPSPAGNKPGGASLNMSERGMPEMATITAPATDAARQWAGWGTALKPAHEPIVVARKPLAGTVAANVLTHGVGGLNIDGCRVAGVDVPEGRTRHGGGIVGAGSSYELPDSRGAMPAGRWPSNIVLTHHPDCEIDCAPSCPVAEMDRTGFGGASRYFPVFRYQAKAPAKERPKVDGAPAHPTVKPLDLMRWLVRLVTPPGGVVLDPFAGSGTTAEACLIEGFDCLAVEREPSYLPLIEARLGRHEPSLF